MLGRGSIDTTTSPGASAVASAAAVNPRVVTRSGSSRRRAHSAADRAVRPHSTTGVVDAARRCRPLPVDRPVPTQWTVAAVPP